MTGWRGLNVNISSCLSAGALKYEHQFFLGQVFQRERKIFLSIEGKGLDCLTRKLTTSTFSTGSEAATLSVSPDRLVSMVSLDMKSKASS